MSQPPHLIEIGSFLTSGAEPLRKAGEATLHERCFAAPQDNSPRRLSQLWSRAALDTDIPADMLRGVGINTVLGGLGNAFRSKSGTQREYLNSIAVDRLGDFISHDWDSPRAAKLLALCIVYNSTPASIAAFLAGLLLTALQSPSLFGVLPFPPPYRDYNVGGWGCWSQALCPFVFLFVLLFWQSIRVRLGLKPKYVFLDKLCVDQVNPERKARAILGLAGFLNKTDRLVICWTPRYFTRLWCVYEVASWLYLRKPLKEVFFMPLAMANVIISLFVEKALACGLFAIGQHVGGMSHELAAMVFILLSPWHVHGFRHMIRHLRELPEQLEAFSMETAQCFCCSVGHKMPGTGEALQCDRKVVCRTIKKWFPNVVSDELTPRSSLSEETVDITHFDQQIRALFGPFILQRSGPMHIPYRYCILIGQPFLWRLLDVVVCFGVWDAPLHSKLAKSIQYLICFLCLIPLHIKWVCRILSLTDRVIGIIRRPDLELVLSVFFFVPFMYLFFVMFVLIDSWCDEGLWLEFYMCCGTSLIATRITFTRQASLLRSDNRNSLEPVEATEC